MSESDLARNDSGTDLSYLHPRQLRIGGTGLFAGTWAFTENGRIPMAFVGTLIDWWKGFAVFDCTREVAEAIVADQQRARTAARERLHGRGLHGDALTSAVDERLAPMWFDGDDIVVDEQTGDADEEDLIRVAPDDDGRYVVNGWRWTWAAVDPAICERIAGVIPPYGQHQQFVMLSHTPLRVPHDRLTVTSVKTLPMGGGVASTALLRLDGRKVGTIDNLGDGGPTQFHPTATTFAWRQMRQFTDACRWQGRPVAEELVLEALVQEYTLTRRIRQTDAAGRSLARLISQDGFTLATATITDTDIDPRDYQALAGQLNARSTDTLGRIWQLWRSDYWDYLGPANTDGSGTAACDRVTS